MGLAVPPVRLPGDVSDLCTKDRTLSDGLLISKVSESFQDL